MLKYIKRNRLENKLIKIIENECLHSLNSVDWCIDEWYVHRDLIILFSIDNRNQMFRINKKGFRAYNHFDEFEDDLISDVVNRIYNKNNYYSIIYV